MQSRFLNKTFGKINTHIECNVENDLCTGDLKYSIRNDDHQGWLKCDGKSILKSSYQKLYELIGDSFGQNTDDTLFNLPNCTGRALASTSYTRSLGQIDGNETHTLAIDELALHKHTGIVDAGGSHNHSGSTANAGGHTHSTNEGSLLVDGTATIISSTTIGHENKDITSLIINPVSDHSHSISFEENHTHNFVTNDTGNSKPFSIMQPTIFIGNVFIHI